MVHFSSERNLSLLFICSLVCLLNNVSAFGVTHGVGKDSMTAFSTSKLYLQSVDDDQPKKDDVNTRRNFVVKSAVGVLSYSILGFGGGIFPVGAAEDVVVTDDAKTTTLPICVIGANGRTGTECVQACLSRSLPVRATSRGGVYRGDVSSSSNNSLLSQTACDVTDASSVAQAVQGTRAVIFAASASKEGGTPSQVDNLGLVTVAKACIAAQVPQLVIVSSGAVTKPNSPVYKFLNLFGNIMAEKIQGEDTVRSLYHDNNQQYTYTIVRPGGLTEEAGKGVSFLELNQGDAKSGRIARADVGALCVESILYPKDTGDTTFECYDADTGKPLKSVGISNILKQKTDSSEFVTGFERQGKTFEDLFHGLTKDA